jgi:hypothetical protein
MSDEKMGALCAFHLGCPRPDWTQTHHVTQDKPILIRCHRDGPDFSVVAVHVFVLRATA